MSKCQNIYLVDDDEDLRLAIKTTLSMAGYKVYDFASAEAFLEVVDEGTCGCLVTDLRLPGISGLVLQQQLNERHINIPVVIITGYGEVNDSVRAIKAGAVNFMEKPVPPAALLEQVAEALRLDESRQEYLAMQARFDDLSPREKAVATLVVAGKTNKQIAQELQISYRTVEKYRAGAMLKLGLENVVELSHFVHRYVHAVTI